MDAQIKLIWRKTMFKTILVPTDGSVLSNIAVTKAIEFAKLNPGSQIIGLSVAEMMPFAAVEGLSAVDPSEYEKSVKALAGKYVKTLESAAIASGISCRTIVAQSSSPAEEILREAKNNACDCIFMASHGRKGMQRVLLGSNTQKVLAEAKIPVVVYRPEVAPKPEIGAQWELMGF
jgi:nucleotide-binding universal stress UspA family protein